jgi:hypothetical protein
VAVGDGNNFFQGGRGRDVFISHGGNSSLLAGSGEAILIGGTTVFGTNVVALTGILAEWSRTDLGYSVRVTHLLIPSSGGLNGPFALNTTTVHSNGSRDVLQTGGGLDLVFFDLFDILPHPARPWELFLEVA